MNNVYQKRSGVCAVCTTAIESRASGYDVSIYHMRSSDNTALVGMLQNVICTSATVLGKKFPVAT